jgi:hypothetical protein
VAKTASSTVSQPYFARPILREISATSASVPPSPLLSAAISTPTYWIETISVIDQKIRLITP